jgi:benzylsuccinate CoA-transferase BbsF subunit
MAGAQMESGAQGKEGDAPRLEGAAPKGLLSGLTVADFGWAVAGPMLSRFLAHHGATVIKIESNTRLDATRIATPFRGKPNRNSSGYFDQHNAGKLSVTFNLKHPEGARLARRLALAADVVNENFVPGVLEKYGLGYAALSAERPDLIMISSSAQGQTGPNARAPGLGVTLQGLVGLAHLTGWPDRNPVGTGEPYTDTLVAPAAGAALMAALDYRRRTGRGMHIDLSQFEIVTHVLAPGMLHEQLAGARHSRLGNASLARAPEGVFACQGEERWCAVSVENDAQWGALADLIGYAGDTPRARQDLAWRMQRREELEGAIAAWMRGRDVAEAQEQLQARGIPAYGVSSNEDVMADPQLAARGHWVERDHPVMGAHLYEMPPFRLEEHAVRVGRAPLIGEHTEQVLSEVLGMDREEIAAARAAGALE